MTTSKLTTTQLMNNINKTTSTDLTATFANLKIDKDQQQQQPRFIRKKPQVIQSIEHFSQGNNLLPLNVLEILMQQTSPSVEEEEQKQSPETDNAIEVMMEELKKQKLEEIMQKTKIKPPFPEEQQSAIRITGSRVQSPSKTKEIDIAIAGEGLMQPQMSMSPERNQSKGRKVGQGGSAQTMEELKQKKIEELTQMLIQEQRLSRQSYHAFMSQPYATTVTNQQNMEQDDCRSESTVQYHLNESAAHSSVKKGQTPQKRAPSPQNLKPALKQTQKDVVQRPKSAINQEKSFSKVYASKVSAIKEQVQQTKTKLTKVNESRNKAQPLVVEKKQFSTQTPISIINTDVSRNLQTTQATATSTQKEKQFKTATSTFQQQVPEHHLKIPSATLNSSIPLDSPLHQPATQHMPLHQIEFYSDSQRTIQQLPGNPQPQNQNMNNIQLSEKTLQIVFRKLQKDCENAIRQADREEKGSLTLEQLKSCLFSMDYLPCMQVEEQEMVNQQQIEALLGYRQHISTKRSLVMQEKEFIYNFWCIINPLNTSEISNALLYDMLLLLIYNVQQPLQTSTDYLNDYLENFYRELNINFEDFASYHSGSSNLTPPLKNNDLSNLNKYLSHCNLWSVERLAFEFRQIHANRLSHLFSSSQQTKKETPTAARNSLSPIMAFQGQNTIINPADGRKYKKAVVEEHLSNMTFSPKINNKTNYLDQKLTHKLMQRDNSDNRENTSSRYIHRDASVDALLTQANHARSQNTNTSQQQFMFNLEPVDANGIFSGACPSFKRYDLLLYRQQITQDKIGRAQEGKLLKQMEECTFHPNLRNSHSPTLVNSKSYQNLRTQTDKVFRDITQRVKAQRSKLMEPTQASQKTQPSGNLTREEKELENCTFHPKINTPQLLRKQENESIAANQHPKGYFEMVNRMRKVNEEKRAIEEKLQKKAIGENYDRAKLMNIKPPSFVVGERPKKKLIMYIDVNITPTRTGRIGIYEGDDVKELAKNFKKTFQLNSSMQTLLTQQLEHHLQVYKEKNGMTEVQGSVFPPESNPSQDELEQQNNLDVFMMMNSRGGINKNLMQSNSSLQTLDGMNLGRPIRAAYLLPNIDEEETKSLQDHPHQNGFNKRSLDLPDNQYMPMTLTNEPRLAGGLTFGQILEQAHKSYQQQSSSSGSRLQQNDAHYFENEDATNQLMDLNQEYQRLGAAGSISHRRRGADQLDCLIASESEKQRPQVPAELIPNFYGFPNNPIITEFQQFSQQNKNESFF